MDVLSRHHVSVSGPEDGRPMVFSHGFGCDQTIWRHVAPAFADRYRVISFDHIGSGGSDASAYELEKYGDLSGYAADVVEIVQALDLRDVVFVGHSVSAMIGALAVIAAPERFGTLVMVSPSPRYIDDVDYTGGFAREEIVELLESMASNYRGWSSAMAPVIVGNPERPALGDELSASFCRMDPDIARQFAATTFLSDNRKDLPEVDVPTLVLQCSRDAIAPAGVGRYVADAVPDATLVLLDATGHCPNLSAPQETIAAIDDFLRQRSCASVSREPVEHARRQVPEGESAALHDQAPFGYLSTTSDGYIVDTNATFCSWLGVRADGALGRHLTELLTAGCRIFYETHCVPILQMQGFVREVAVDFLRADGTRLPVLLSASLARTPDGEPDLVRLALFNATERRAFERELIRTRDEQEVELRARAEQVASATATVSQIIDAATNTLLVATDADLIITHFNRGAHEMLGHLAEEMIGSSTARFLDADEVRRHADALGVSVVLSHLVPALVRHGAPRDWTLTTRSQERRTVSLSFTEIRDDRRLVGYLCTGEDVSIRLRTEAAQAAALHRELESVARLKEADKLKDEVVTTISHELRTPLAAIQGYCEILADGDLGALAPRQSGAVAKVLRNSARLSALVDDLLLLDRIGSAHEVPLHLHPHDLTALVLEAHDGLEQLARGRDLRLDLHVPDRPTVVLGDWLSLERVVFNLGGNAIKFTPDGGSVTLTVASTPVGCVLTFVDTGIGISEEDQSQVRGRFYRSSEARRLAVPGTGLGLTVVDAIVAAHGGTMHIASTPGHGTTVTVVLPAYETGAD